MSEDLKRLLNEIDSQEGRKRGAVVKTVKGRESHMISSQMWLDLLWGAFWQALPRWPWCGLVQASSMPARVLLALEGRTGQTLLWLVGAPRSARVPPAPPYRAGTGHLRRLR